MKKIRKWLFLLLITAISFAHSTTIHASNLTFYDIMESNNSRHYKTYAIDPKSFQENVYQDGLRDIAEDIDEVDGKIANILTECNKKNTDYERIMYILEWLRDNTEYNRNINDPYYNFRYTLVSCFLDDMNPTCEGYSSAFQCLCQELGIPCRIVYGHQVWNGQNLGETCDHSWNQVQMQDGKWYAVDATWAVMDMQNNNPEAFDYILTGSTVFNQSHTVDYYWYGEEVEKNKNLPAISESNYDRNSTLCSNSLPINTHLFYDNHDNVCNKYAISVTRKDGSTTPGYTFRNVSIGDTFNISNLFEVAPRTATNRNLVYKSADPSKITVDQNGNVKILSAKTYTNKTYDGTVSILTSDVLEIKVFPEDDRLDVGYETVYFEINKLQTIAPTPTQKPTPTPTPTPKPYVYVPDNSIPLKSFKLNRTKATMSLGEEVELYMLDNYKPENATNTELSWSTNNPNVATVEDGIVTCVGPGNCKITATTTDGSNKKVTCSITGPKAPSSIKITGPKEISKDQTIHLDATLKPANAVPTKIFWSVVKGNGHIDQNGNLTCDGSGDIKVQAVTGNNKKGTFTVKGPKAPSSVKITGPKEISKDQTIMLSATVKPANAIDTSVSWSVIKGNGTINSQTGELTCNGSGDIKVQAITNNGKKGTFTVKGPKAPSGVKITGQKEISLNETITLSAEVKPANAIEKDVTWSVLKGNGRINANTGELTCDGAGDIKVQAITKNNKKGTFTVKGPKAPSSVKIEGPKQIENGQSITLTATIKPTNAIEKDVAWSVVKGNGHIDPKSGVLTCDGAGDIKVQAITNNGKKGAFTVKGPKAVSGVSVKASTNKLTVGETASASATVKPNNAIDTSVSWSTDNPAVATISEDGTITAVSAGKANIIATAHNGKAGKCSITVK